MGVEVECEGAHWAQAQGSPDQETLRKNEHLFFFRETPTFEKMSTF